MSKENSDKQMILSQVFAGVGIGLLVGIIVGLSVSPVVKIILGSLAGLLAAFLGFQDSIFSKQNDQDNAQTQHLIKMSSIRSGSFGFACVAGILAGVLLRSHDVLTISTKAQVARWVEAGYDSSYARDLVVYQKLRLQPDSAKFTVNPEVAALTIDASGGFLFTKKEMLNYCTTLSMSTYNDNVEYTLEAYDGMTPEIRNLAANIRKVPGSNQKLIIESTVGLICSLGNGEGQLEDFCNNMEKNFDHNNIINTLDEFTSSDNFELAILASDILKFVPDDQDKYTLFKSIIEVVCKPEN